MLAAAVRWSLRWPPGSKPGRGEIDAYRQARRLREVCRAREAFRRVYDGAEPALRRFLSLAGMAPDEAVIRWGNHDQVLLLSARVFEPDDREL